MTTDTSLVCPKDQSPMKTYERNGVMIDRCTDCGGIFLDRGELERLTEAEGSYNTERGWGDQERSWNDEAGRSGKGRRRGGFLGDLLDFG